MSDLMVIYLIRNDGVCHENLNNFLISLKEFGIPESLPLLFLFKGFKSYEVETLRRVNNILNHSFMSINDHLFDLNSYIECANSFKFKYLLFLNSYSEVNCSNWLDIYLQASHGSDSVIVGSTASFECLGYNPPLLDKKNSLSKIIWIVRVIMRRMNSIRFMFSATGFPNPHIRTNAFLIDRNSFLEYFRINGYPKSKFDCHLVESGPKGLTKYMIKKGATVVIVSNNGEVFNVSDWGSANLFRANNSSDRLVFTDNRTREYTNASIEKKAQLIWDAWRVKI
jgi:hypothetical protein